jgi:hypothetical protein
VKSFISGLGLLEPIIPEGTLLTGLSVESELTKEVVKAKVPA